MKFDRQRSRRLAATLGIGAAAVAAPIVIATGALSTGSTLGSEDPTSEESTELSPDPGAAEESTPTTTFTYAPPTVEPENPGVPGNPGGTLGDIG